MADNQKRDAYAASSPDAVTKLYPRQDHEFRDSARVDRLDWLRSHLRIAG